MLHAIQNMKSQIDCFIDTVEITLLILSQCENNIVVEYHFYSNNKTMCFTSEYIIKNCLLWIDSLSFVSFCNNFRLFSSPTSYPQEKNSSQKVYVKTVSAFRIFLNEKVFICWVLIESHVMYPNFKKSQISIIPFIFAVFIGTVECVSQNAPMKCIIVVSDIKTYRLQIF